MLVIACWLLLKLGASEVLDIDQFDDPQTEEEFKKLRYISAQPITWEQYQAAIPDYMHKKGIQLIRQKRNDCLQKTDYIMTVDFFNTVRNRDEWIGYRQALRDFPEEIKTIVWIVPGQTINWDATGFPKAPPIIKYT